MKHSIFNFRKCLLSLALAAAQLSSATANDSALYDNLSLLIPTDENAIGPPHDLGASAQLFTTGKTGEISSVTIIMGKKGNPGGFVSVEIWDQDGETPGNKIADVGQIDLTTLAPLSGGGETITFTPEISGLSPDTPYFLLFENTTATIPDADNTYEQFFATTTEGSGESAQVIARPTPDNWVSVSEPARRWILKITEPGTSALGLIKTRSLFNNLPERPGFSKHWGFPTHNRGMSAQQFMTNELGEISTISFATGAKGNPSGTIAVEIWDDEEGFPKSKVAEVGVIDLDKLTPREEGGELLTYHVSIDRLEPNSPYYLVQINAGAQIDSENTFVNFLTPDANGTGGSQERMIHPGQWEILTTFNPDYPLSSAYTVLRITAGTGVQESPLYDNFPTPDFTSENTIFPQRNRGASAQPFRTGEHGLISSISFNTSAVGNPSGTVSVELWDDDEGKPGTMIAHIGTVDLATLPSKESGGKQMTFTGPFTGLKPNSVYYLVKNNAAAVIDSDNSLRTQVTDKSGGFSRGTGELLLKPDDWVPANSLVSGLGLSSVYGVFEITESTEDIPKSPIEISSIQRRETATILDLKVRPFLIYTLEYSESLAPDSWIEIDDQIESAGFQITYEDTDPERQSKARGYYRLRKTTID